MNQAEKNTFLKKRHVQYLKRCLDILPGRYCASDSNRATIAFFAISGLDLLNSLSILDDRRSDIINWIYSLQILPDSSDDRTGRCGFQGSTSSGMKFSINDKLQCDEEISKYTCAHVTMTYTSLACLLILGDDLQRVNRSAIINSLKAVQLPNGSFQPSVDSGENDMRFLYCACCISYMLNDWSGINISTAIEYIVQSQSYEGGIGQGPWLEAHGGSSFCAIASLHMMNKLTSSFTKCQTENLKKWCIMRQLHGFHGRPNKIEDSCYSFWIGATLMLLEAYNCCDKESIFNFTLSAQDSVIGGFSKWPNSNPDLLHTYLSIAGLSLLNHPDLLPIHPALNISQRAVHHLKDLQLTWNKD